MVRVGHLRCKRSGSAEITAVAFTACGGWQNFSKNEMRKLDILPASNVSLAAETGVRKKSVGMRKLKLQVFRAITGKPGKSTCGSYR